jgi:hypothetical protein
VLLAVSYAVNQATDGMTDERKARHRAYAGELEKAAEEE